MFRFAALAILLAATAAHAAVFTGSIDGPADVDRYSLAHPAGDFTARINADTTLAPTLGLFDDHNRLLALTGPGESLYAVVPAGLYQLVVTGEGRGRYSIDVPGGVSVPEPATLAVLVIPILLMRRRTH